MKREQKFLIISEKGGSSIAEHFMKQEQKFLIISEKGGSSIALYSRTFYEA